MADEFQAVVNDEEQYSIWPLDLPLPAGWRAAGRAGTREECLAYIAEVWTDLRPVSARKIVSDAAGEAGTTTGKTGQPGK